MAQLVNKQRKGRREGLDLPRRVLVLCAEALGCLQTDYFPCPGRVSKWTHLESGVLTIRILEVFLPSDKAVELVEELQSVEHLVVSEGNKCRDQLVAFNQRVLSVEREGCACNISWVL